MTAPTPVSTGWTIPDIAPTWDEVLDAWNDAVDLATIAGTTPQVIATRIVQAFVSLHELDLKPEPPCAAHLIPESGGSTS